MLKKMKRFLKETSGSIAPMTAVMLIPLVIAAGAVVDYTTYANTRTKMQAVIDSAALATSRRAVDIASEVSPDQMEARLTEYAERFVEANLPESLFRTDYEIKVSYSEPQNALEIEKSVTVEAAVEYDTIFGGLNGSDGGKLLVVDKINEDLESIVVFGNRSVEVVLVVDNSGSMGALNKIGQLRDASTNLVNDLFDTVNPDNDFDRERVKMGIVPFSTMVNIGTEYKRVVSRDRKGKTRERTVKTKSRPWFDLHGWASYHHENFNWSSYTANRKLRTPFRNSVQERVNGNWRWLSRLSIYDRLNVDWLGCVEMRPYPYNTQDDFALRSRGWKNLTGASWRGFPRTDDADKLFVPTFSPDEPDRQYLEHISATNPDSRVNLDINQVGGNAYDNTTRKNDKYSFDWGNYLDDFSVPRQTSDNIVGDSHVVNHIFEYTKIPGQRRRFRNPGEPMHFGEDYQILRTDYMGKYVSPRKWAQNGVSLDSGANISGPYRGPNEGCFTRPITPLTNDRQLLLDEISELESTSTTNIQAGLVWGWRTVSHGPPFEQGRSEDDSDNLKFIILLSDGANFYGYRKNNPNEGYYGAWGYSRPPSVASNPWMQYPSSHPTKSTHNRISAGLTSSDLAGTIYAGESFDTTPDSTLDFERIMNAHTVQTCNNAKENGVSVYTIAFSLNDPFNRTKPMLEACAGSGLNADGEELVPNTTFYYEVDNGELNAAFEQIGAQISEIRIAQ